MSEPHICRICTNRRSTRPATTKPVKAVTWALTAERVTGIEPAFSAWEAETRPFRDQAESPKSLLRQHVGVTASDRQTPLMTAP